MFVYLFICLSVCLFVCLSVYLFICLSVYLFICLSVYLFICLSVYLFICLSVYLFICLSVYLFICLSVYLFICLSVYLFICLSVYLFICLSVYLFICLSVYLFICLSVYLFICLFVYLFICLFIYVYLHSFCCVCLFFSCIQAFPPVNASVRNASCIFYEYTGEFCKGIITSLYVYGDQSTLDYGEKETSTFKSYFDLFDIAPNCRPIMKDLYCRYHFPPCDESLGKPEARPICRSTCEYLDQDVCKREMIFIRNASKTAPIFDHDMINCSLYKTANGGDAPECYQWDDFPGAYITVISKSFM